MRLPMEIRVLTVVAALLAALAAATGVTSTGTGTAASGTHLHHLHLSAVARPLAGTDDPGTWGWG